MSLINSVPLINIKKIAFLILYFSSFTLPAFSETLLDGQPVLYCPNHIECAADGKLESCHLSDNQYEFWGNPGNRGRVVKGIYRLKEVVSVYQTDDSSRTICHYSLIDGQGITKLMSVFIKGPGSSWQGGTYSPNIFNAFLDNLSQWSVTGWNADCISSDPKLCPLVEIPEIAYLNQPSENTFIYNGSVFSSSSLSYDRLLSVCGASSFCYVDIGAFDKDTPEGRQFKLSGSVRVDLSLPDVVHIVTISTDPSSPCLFKKKEPFNTIYCEPREQ